MEYVDLQEEIDRLMRAGNPVRAGALAACIYAFPSCRGVRSRWGDVRVCCAGANTAVERLEFERGFGPLRVWLYVAIGPNECLYSDPPFFVVSDPNPRGFGEIPRPGWYGDMAQAHIPRPILQKVTEYLDQHPPVNYADEP